MDLFRESIRDYKYRDIEIIYKDKNKSLNPHLSC